MAKDFAQLVRLNAHTIINGTVLAIDPASGGSSLPGWAAWSKGEFVSAGVLGVKPGCIQERLYSLHQTLAGERPDVLVIESIRGRKAHVYLTWSVGVIIAATCPLVLLEMPISTWKKHAGKDHQKNDMNDAIAIGRTMMDMATMKMKTVRLSA